MVICEYADRELEELFLIDVLHRGVSVAHCRIVAGGFNFCDGILWIWIRSTIIGLSRSPNFLLLPCTFFASTVLSASLLHQYRLLLFVIDYYYPAHFVFMYLSNFSISSQTKLPFSYSHLVPTKYFLPIRFHHYLSISFLCILDQIVNVKMLVLIKQKKVIHLYSGCSLFARAENLEQFQVTWKKFA